ncbi:hypothetical protein [Helicobacter pylori]|uniref:hypothetical protein n=1 Tax=Helicobacter pylori TaxID=210 RepID=UPI000FDE2A89|nr:hypothetical protein [Helicobacter pylori]
MFSPFWIKLKFYYICIGMYLEYYSIKRFFLSFGENFVIFLILMLFVSFGGVVWWCGLKDGCGEWI